MVSLARPLAAASSHVGPYITFRLPPLMENLVGMDGNTLSTIWPLFTTLVTPKVGSDYVDDHG